MRVISWYVCSYERMQRNHLGGALNMIFSRMNHIIYNTYAQIIKQDAKLTCIMSESHASMARCVSAAASRTLSLVPPLPPPRSATARNSAFYRQMKKVRCQYDV